MCARSPRAGGRQLTERGARSGAELGMPGPSNRKTGAAVRSLEVLEVDILWPRWVARCLFRVRRTPTPSASNWPRYLPRKLVGGGGAASPSERRKGKQCMLCAQTELVAQADACAVLRTWFSRRGRPRGETSREHSRQGPQGVPRDHRLFDFVWISCSLLPPRCPVHPTHGVS